MPQKWSSAAFPASPTTQAPIEHPENLDDKPPCIHHVFVNVHMPRAIWCGDSKTAEGISGGCRLCIRIVFSLDWWQSLEPPFHSRGRLRTLQAWRSHHEHQRKESSTTVQLHQLQTPENQGKPLVCPTCAQHVPRRGSRADLPSVRNHRQKTAKDAVAWN